MKATVFVTYKPGVLDPQGQTVCGFLQNRGESRVRNVRIGKLVEFDLSDMSREEASRLLDDVGRTLLANPVIETYRVEVP
ncbi:phosphoribosylformylglycinamidine synthase subunit PurS [bacterium]|nr:phosphoribosylformylglycinamidine synthase subunit PurS [bacterium]MBU1983398.1 phosphoribosylformylglycinamidine synthase subunit PurS [bacterium]